MVGVFYVKTIRGGIVILVFSIGSLERKQEVVFLKIGRIRFGDAPHVVVAKAIATVAEVAAAIIETFTPYHNSNSSSNSARSKTSHCGGALFVSQ